MRRKGLGIVLGSLAILAMSSCTPTYNPDDQIEGRIKVEGVGLNKNTLSLKVGKSYSLYVSISPSDATNQNVTWSSSNKAVATVTNGVIKAIKVGTATITVTTSDGNYKDSCVVTVVEEVEEEGDDYVPPTSADILKITAGGEYTLDKNYKQVYVDAPEAEVIINLNGKTIENSENSPIYVKDCDSIEISASKGMVNTIKDTRALYSTDDSTQGNGAIYVVNGDLKLKGTGVLNLTAGYYNGIHAKDDVKLQKLTLNLTAPNHGIRGNDSITVTSGTINISCGGDGLTTTNSDISSKGKQRGIVTLNGGDITINSWGDAISATYDTVVEELDSTIPLTFNANTNKLSSYSGDSIDTSTSKFYLKMNSSTYSNGNYTYAAYINENWYKATYKGTITSQNPGGWGGRGGTSTTYAYEIDKPSGATSFTLYRFQGSNVTNFSTSSYNAVSDAKAFNDAYDSVQISVSSGRINFGSWSNYSSNGRDTSAKGIKADNEILVKSGKLNLKTYDDALHANNDSSLDNGASPKGNVTISGGTVNVIEADDDALHADNVLNISGGKVTVTKSYEGAEGNVINVSGGETIINATDDGLNAGKGNSTPLISVTGGLLDVTVPSSGDTDGIDSNGNFTQSGGVVIAKGPASASRSTMGAAALDTDGAVTLNNGTLIVFGGIEKTPTTSLTKTICSSSTVSTGTKTVTVGSESYTTTLTYSTNGCVVYASGTATLK